MGFLRDCTGKGDKREELAICDNGKEKFYIVNQGPSAGGDVCGLHASSQSTENA